MASVFERGKEKFHHVLSNTRVCCFKQQCNDSRVSFSLVVWHQNNIVTLQSIIRVTYYIPKKPLLHQEIFEDQIPASIKNTLKISTYNRPLNTQIIFMMFYFFTHHLNRHWSIELWKTYCDWLRQLAIAYSIPETHLGILTIQISHN